MAKKAKTPTSPPRTGGKTVQDLGAAVLETALALAEERGWSAVRLHDVARRLGVPPDRILGHYRDLDGVADAWFRRALAAMIAPRPRSFASLPARERIETCMLAWLDALAPHRRVTMEMLRGKMHLAHPHHWVPAIFNLSRTIHWLREAALLPAPYGTRRAQTEEVGLSLLFLATLRVWGGDESEGQRRTRDFLRRRLAGADRLLARLYGPAPRAEST